MVQIVECRGQAVAAMLARSSSKGPQGVLQPFGESDIALASEDDVGVLEAGVDQTEVIEPMIQRNTGDLDTQIPHLGEV